ncbi:hypothetical protein BASA50_010310 [Batrachochytrium salamandrivorans]|uniref:UBL3-like ubiquitin domain-containing protein n=1 Tax=Batrachochytrium salamandrivorans TaxID=1357716 RepID=A0ABQ8F1R2_9FUNG|nr:hypothetical protein BASA62_007631 [Batrachochytrium salamandrivorans]KAH6565882.1 hypothetical protein BASA60_009741 [Batrachochytrium salamandrivorans]KAH6589026.1 hypothetical protein BASA50_010310 [Batrachochytrium salamandrivorans]KAH6593600.1 hypothetical protein BASA61_004249 [Batrachochytrium salamandrivorans]KAH9263906.1 hypothetical protein BASA83_012650 [Batrachochytrium salamandrivorans]
MTDSAAVSIPADKVNLRLLLVSGKKSDFLFAATDTIDAVCAHIALNWPADWVGEIQPKGSENVKILLRGKFLERNSTIQGNAISAGDTTVVHVLVKNDVSTPESKKLESSSGCSCSIL